MPIDDKGRVICVTHGDVPMVLQQGYHFLSELEKNKAGGLNLRPTHGMPLTTYVCSICGYVENYAAMATKEWTMKRLYVRCKNGRCRREFFSPVQMDEESFGTATLRQNSYQCSFCKKANTYDKEDHFFK